MDVLSRVSSIRCSLLLRVVPIALGTLTMSLPLRAAPPPWWYGQGVIDESRQPNDYAAVNQGQVKFMAQRAMLDLEAHLPGGAGAAIRQMVGAWGTPTATTNDFSAVNQGQLKKVAQPFYDQLIRVGYVSAYPWNSSLAQANDYAAANVGQVKNLFSFDLTSIDSAHDANGDGLPDWWANYYHLPAGAHADDPLPWGGLTYLQAFLQNLNPVDFFDGVAPAFVASSGNGQHGAPGEFLPLPLTVTVAVNGAPVANAPIRFTVSQGGGRVQRSSNSPSSASVLVVTDGTGQAKAFFKLSDAPGSTNQIVAMPGSGNYPASHAFTATSDTPPGTNPSPFDPSNVVATMNADGSADVSWTNNADPTDTEPIDLMYRDKNGAWQALTNVPAGTTFYHIPAP